MIKIAKLYVEKTLTCREHHLRHRHRHRQALCKTSSRAEDASPSSSPSPSPSPSSKHRHQKRTRRTSPLPLPNHRHKKRTPRHQKYEGSSMGITPQDYQESVKAKEFVTFLRMHGVEVGETETSSPSRQADPNDCVQVLKKLHIGVQLLLSTSKRPSKVDIRQRFEELIMKQAAWFLGGDLDRVQDANHQIQSILQEEVKQEERVQQSHNNMEIDLYMHGWSKTGLLPAAIAFSFTNLAGISYTITPLNPTPQPRDPVSIDSSLQVTPLAKRKTNVVNVGEVATSKGNLLKKIAQLERAATYALVRATNQTEDVLQVVGYGSLGMMTDAAHFARTIISLHPDMFPCLTSLQSKGALAYLHSDRSVFKDIETIAESIGNIKSEIHVMKCLFFAFGVAMVAMSFLKRH